MEDHFLMFPLIIIIAAGYLIVYTVKVAYLIIQIVIKIFSKSEILKDSKLKGEDENVNQ